MISVMVDLETFGSQPGGAISQIGAVAFDPDGSWISDTAFHANATSPSGFSDSNIRWWLAQSEAARASLDEPPPVPLSEALLAFSYFYRSWGPAEVWAHGANFDLVILNHWFEKVCIDRPWHWRDERCTRTLLRLRDRSVFSDLYEAEDLPNHVAWADAKRQAMMVQRVTGGHLAYHEPAGALS